MLVRDCGEEKNGKVEVGMTAMFHCRILPHPVIKQGGGFRRRPCQQ